MTDATPTPGTFDLVAVLQGRDYPTIDVPFYLDEVSAFALGRAEKEQTRLETLGRAEDAEKVAQTIEDLKERLGAGRYVYHLKGIPQKVKDDIRKVAYEKFPREDADHMATLLGREKENPERDRFFSVALLQAMTIKIVAPDGREQVAPTLEQVEQFVYYVPQASFEKILAAQGELLDGGKSGFEMLAQESDFS